MIILLVAAGPSLKMLVIKTLLHPHLLAVVVLLRLQGMFSVEIKRLTVPRWVQNGTDENVVLDCEYVYNENDFRLVVKWFFNDDPEPVYQWIPELNVRHVAVFLKNRIDMRYSANPIDPYSRYRALRLRRPTTDMSGKYACLVTSLAGQDSREQEMIVYATPKRFEFNYTKLTSNHYNFTCEAEGVYPQPQMSLLMVSNRRGSPSSVVSGVTATMESSEDSGYNIKLHRIFRAKELQALGPTIFECVLEMTGTNYVSKRRLGYYPDPDHIISTNASSILTSSLVTLLITSISSFMKQAS